MLTERPHRQLLPSLIVVACALASVLLSLFESKFNIDAHHWGLMYSNAADLVAGLVPYKQIFIQYGYLTTLVHALSLLILGNSVVSIGITTGVFYAVSIVLSYLFWLRYMDKRLACLSAVMMFLIHGYIIYPWANYVSYTFVLTSLLLITAPAEKWQSWLLAGVALSLGFVARQTSLLSTLAPFYLLFLYDLVAVDGTKSVLRRVLYFHAGFVVPTGAYLFYLTRLGALHDWYVQNFELLSVYTSIYGGTKVLVKRFPHSLLLWGWDTRDIRFVIYTLVLICAVAAWLRTAASAFKQRAEHNGRLRFLASSVVLLGFLQAFHIFEIFRLQNAASLGMGFLFVHLDEYASGLSSTRLRSAAFVFPTALLFVYLGSTLAFVGRNSVYNRWHIKQLASHQLAEPRDVDFLRVKLLNPQLRAYYQELSAAIEANSGHLEYFVNRTRDCYNPLLAKRLKQAYIAPFYYPEIFRRVFPENLAKVEDYLKEGRALIVADSPEEIPSNYRIVKTLKEPDGVPMMKEDRSTIMAVPIQ
jgi:hypothetical protein